MACASGEFHTVTLSDEGVVRSFGRNNYDDVSLPRPIPNLPQIMKVACGVDFTICIDYEGFLWSFGRNNNGQLGTGNTKTVNFPQKILNIPPVHSVACGDGHTLIITNGSELWSCGNNKYGQLCLGNREYQSTFQQTTFSNISKISVGSHYSLFENSKGEIYSCGFYENGNFGLKRENNIQYKATLIPNLPSNIVQFVCGYHHSLFLDLEGNVFSFGNNQFGQLGLGHQESQTVLNKIPNIPPIQSISCVGYSSYLIDMEGNFGSFGDNRSGQLGIGNYINPNVPTKVEDIIDIRQMSSGPHGSHFLVKTSENVIFATGRNAYHQLGIPIGKAVPTTNFIAMNFNADSEIWGDGCQTKAKSARK